MNSKQFSISAFILIILSVFSSCSETIGTMQDFKHNKYPEILSFTCDPSGSITLDPNTPVTLTVTATDPEGEKLKFSYDSEDGSFTGQSDTDDTSTVTFYSASYLTSSETIKARVKVTDDKKFSVSQEIEIGSTRSGPTITSIGSIPAYISSDSEVEYTFSANSSGLYQVQVLSSGTSSTSFSSSYATYFYGAGEYITVTICGNDLDTGDAKMTVNTEGAANNIAVVMQDSLGSETSSIFKLTVDDTDPVSSVNPATGTATVLTAIPVTISATDNASGAYGICYTTDGTMPDFSGNGTVVSGSSATLTIGKSGTSGLGTYTLNYIVMDNCGNTEAVNTATYYIKSDTTAPGTVTNPILSQICDDTIVVTYGLPADSDFDHVQAVCTSAGGIITQATSDSNTCTISGLTADTEYTIIIYAYDTYNNISNPSDSISITTPTSAYSSLMDVYYIRVLSDMETLQKSSGYWNNFCLLVNDITAGTSTPIGNTTTQFTGFFEGNSKTISGVTINDSSSSYQGFFGYILGGTVRNLNLTGLSITGYEYTGGLAGFNSGQILNCTVSGAVTGSYQYTGGLAGESCYNSSSIVSPYIYNCSSTVNVTATLSNTYYVGGLVGWNNSNSVSAVISNSHASGTVYAPYSRFVGGLVGENYNSSGAEIKNCYAAGKVTGNEYTGGLVGNNYYLIESSYATGNVTGNSYNTGGITGQNYYGEIIGCYYSSSSGVISGTTRTGGLIGENSGTVSQCYAVGNTISGTLNVGGLIGYNTNTVSGTSTTYTYAQFDSLKGTYHIGGLIGNNIGNISYCYSIVDVTSTDTGTTGCIGGLIGKHADSTIENCHSSGTISGTYYTGGLIGQNVSGTVTSCYSEADVSGSSNDVGGLIGLNSGGTISSCTASGDVYGLSYTGGLIGDNTGNITSCSAIGNVENTDGNDSNYSGGLIAYNTGKITDCYSTGAVFGRNEGTGGLIGYNTGNITYCHVIITSSSDAVLSHNLGVRGVNQATGGFVGYNLGATIEYCYVILDDSLAETLYVGAMINCGGFVGYNSGTINYCYSTVPVFGWTSGGFGGFAGYNIGNIYCCYARGSVSGSSTINSGGFAGYNTGAISYCYETGAVSGTSLAYGFSGNQVTVTSCYYNIANDSIGTNGIGIGVLLTSMINQSTFSGWIFSTIWEISTSLNDNFPYLQAIPPSE